MSFAIIYKHEFSNGECFYYPIFLPQKCYYDLIANDYQEFLNETDGLYKPIFWE